MVNFVSRDLQSTTAKNVKFVEKQSGPDLMTAGPSKLKEALNINNFVGIPYSEGVPGDLNY